MTSAPSAPETTTETSSGINRRTVVRGAVVTAWAVPAVTLVTAAPAFAVSSVLTISNFTAGYVNASNAATVDPTKLVVNATIGNSGVFSTAGFVFSLKIPAGFYATAPTVAPGAGFTASVAAGGSLANGWTINFTPAAQIPVNGTTPFNATLTFTDPAAEWTDAPFRRWSGNAFTLTASATATNANANAAAAAVAATPNVTWQFSGRSVAGAGSIGVRPRAVCKITDLWNTGRSSTGQITLVVQVNKDSGSSVFGNTPKPTPENTDSKWEFIGSNVATTPNGPWQYTFRSKVTGYAPTAANGGPATDFDGPVSNNSFSTEIMGNYAFGDVNVNVGGTITLTAPHTTPVN